MRIYWVVDGLQGNEYQGYRSVLASYRYRCILPANWMKNNGHEVQFVSHHAIYEKCVSQRPDAIVVAKRLPQSYQKKDLIQYDNENDRFLKDVLKIKNENNVPIVVDINDDHFNHPLHEIADYWRKIVGLADCMIIGSEAFTDIIKEYAASLSVVIEDPYESLPGIARAYHAPGHVLKIVNSLFKKYPWFRNPLQLAWYGNPGNWNYLTSHLHDLSQVSNQYPFVLKVITSNRPEIRSFIDGYNSHNNKWAKLNFCEWQQDTIWDDVDESHMVLIPTDLKNIKNTVKTSNRLVEALNIGCFVVAQPIPAYKKFKEYIWLGEKLSDGVQWAIKNPDKVLQKIKSGQDFIRKNYDIAVIANQWINAITKVVDSASINRVSQKKSTHKNESKPIDGPKLNLGCGDKILSGYINVDVAPSRSGKNPDVICDLRDLSQFGDNSVDEILSVHVVEHFWRWEVEDILMEWARVLKPGGRMIIECPNLVSACENFLNDPELGIRDDRNAQLTMWVFYGDPNWRDPLMVHRWGYTPESLKKLLETIGLINVSQEPAIFKLREPRDMRIVGIKSEGFIATGRVEVKKEIKSKHDAAQLSCGDDYLRWYFYHNVWKYMTYHGIRTLKLPSDMWNYQEIIFEHDIQWVIETGTRHGGSALFFSHALSSKRATGHVITVDVDSNSCQLDPETGIDCLIGDSASNDILSQVDKIMDGKRGKLFLILDSDHRRNHVFNELCLWVPWLKGGDYLVVEDTCVNGHPVREQHGPGPWEAVQDFMAQYPHLLINDELRENKFGVTVAPRGYFIRQ